MSAVAPALRRPGLIDSARRIAPLAWPVFVGQLAVLAFSTVDTLMAARSSALDLAALAIGGAAYISIFIGLMGVVLAVGPIAGQLFGARRHADSGVQLFQAMWLALMLAVPGCTLLLFPEPFLDLWDSAFAGWGHAWTAGELASMVIALGLVKFLAVLLVQQWQPLKFALIPGQVKTMRVHDQAVRQFKVGARGRTAAHTGVLIYLSMKERRAEIVADESIAAKVSAEVWGEAMGDMLAEIRKGRIAEGLAVGVRDVGHVLAEHFPRGDEDDNELPDRLIEI